MSGPRFIDNGDGTVTDTKTGLMWMKDAGFVPVRYWENGVEFCKNLKFAGYQTWRLPTQEEIRVLLETIQNSPDHPFLNVQYSGYWVWPVCDGAIEEGGMNKYCACDWSQGGMWEFMTVACSRCGKPHPIAEMYEQVEKENEVLREQNFAMNKSGVETLRENAELRKCLKAIIDNALPDTVSAIGRLGRENTRLQEEISKLRMWGTRLLRDNKGLRERLVALEAVREAAWAYVRTSEVDFSKRYKGMALVKALADAKEGTVDKEKCLDILERGLMKPYHP